MRFFARFFLRKNIEVVIPNISEIFFQLVGEILTEPFTLAARFGEAEEDLPVHLPQLFFFSFTRCFQRKSQVFSMFEGLLLVDIAPQILW